MLRLDWTTGERPLTCRACGESCTGVLLARIRGGEPEDIPVVRCPVCGTLELLDEPLDWSPNDEVIDDYIEAGAGIGTIVSFLQLADPEPVTRFLDVGCNYGFTVDYGTFHYGWQSLGVEPSLAGVRGAAELGVDIRVEYLSERSEIGDGYDLALSSEVVEHVPEPVGFLRAIRERLAPSARLVLTTPDAATVDPALPELAAIHALSPGFHVFLATADGLGRLLARAGFASVAVRSTGGTLYAVAAVEAGAAVAVAEQPHVDQLALEQYFLARFASAPAGSALSAGMAVRLLRSRVNRAAFDDSDADAERAIVAYDLRHSAELAEPWRTRAAIESDDAAPRALPGAAYALGMLELLHRRHSDRALAYFELARSAAEIWIRTVGMPDLDIDDLLVQSRQLIEHSSQQLADEEQARRETLAYEAELRVIEAERRVIAASQALAGRLGAGESGAVDAEIDELRAAFSALSGLDLADAGSVAAGLAAAPRAVPRLAETAFTLGLAELRRDAELPLAAELFDVARRAAAADSAAGDPTGEQLAVEAGLSRLRTLVRFDADRALTTAIGLLPGLPASHRPEVEEIAVRFFVDVVVGRGGRPDAAVRHAIAAAAPALAGDADPGRAATGLNGLYALGADAAARGESLEARAWFGRCLAAAGMAPDAPNAESIATLAAGSLAALP